MDLDVALREWPDVKKTAEDWDDRTQSVMGRLRRGERGVTSGYIPDEILLASPLGQSSEDGHNSASPGGSGFAHPPLNEKIREENPMTMPADRERDRRSLQDLAKMAHGLTPPPSSVGSAASGVQRAAEAKEDDSGIVDLAAASQVDPNAGIRAQTTPLASKGLFDDEPQSVRPMPAAPSSPNASQAPLGVLAQPIPSIPPAPVSMAPSSLPPQATATSSAQLGSLPLPETTGKKADANRAVIAWVIGGVVALSAAAGGILYARSKPATSPIAQTSTVTPAEPVAAVHPASTAMAPATEPSMDPNALPAAPVVDAPVVDGRSALAPKSGAKAPSATKNTPVAPGAVAKPAHVPAALAEKEPPQVPAGPGGDLGSAMKNVVGDEPAKTPAAAVGGNAATGNVPQKPSQGAVTGAIGAVLPHARDCIGPDDPISRASIVFGSSGAAQSVTVTGAAAGKPAEACIKSALMKAKVQPFAEPNYSANITIRHN